MSREDPLNWPYWLCNVADGQRSFSLLSRKIIANLRPDLFQQLPFEDDQVFLNPLFFAAFAGANPAEEIGHVVSHCFASEHGGFADASPSIAGDDIDLRQIALPDTARSQALDFCPGSGEMGNSGRFTVYGDIHRLIRPLFKLTDGTTGSISSDDLVGRSHLRTLQRSLVQISISYPAFFRALADTTRGFMIYRAPGMNSFASESAHGISFLSVPADVTAPYFVEDIAHQCGHIVFNAMFFDREALFETPPDEPISKFTGADRDIRSVFIVFHAVFTEHVIAKCLVSCLESPDFCEIERDEARGRLAFIMKKYEADLGSLQMAGRRAEDGERLYQELESSFDELYAKVGSRIRGIDLSGQRYNFDFGIYAASNCVQGFRLTNP